MSAPVDFLVRPAAVRPAVRHRYTERLFLGRYGFRIGCSGAWLDTAVRGGRYARGGPDRVDRRGAQAQVAQLIVSLEALCQGDWLISRCRDRLDIYLEARQDWLTMIDQHGGLISRLWSPRDATELALMQGNTALLLRDRLFYHRFAHRVCFRTRSAALADEVHAWCQASLVECDGRRRGAWSRRPLRVYLQDDCDTILVQLRFAPHILRIDRVTLRNPPG
jgi:hypothetical protein